MGTMTESNTTRNTSAGGNLSARQVNEQVLIVQVLVGIFLYINSLLIFTFFRKERFYTNTRYILFAHTLICDCVFLVMTDLLLVLSYFGIGIPAGLCVVFCSMISIVTFSTPLTLTAMSVERYVAICMPLRHAELVTAYRAVRFLLVIHALSSVQLIIVLSIFMASAPLSFYATQRICSVEMIVVYKWQAHIRSAVSQFYFLVMSSIIIFSYVRIMKAAKKVTMDKKKSTSKGLKTILLHAVQLFLCLIQFWTPFAEAAVLEVNLSLFINLRYFDYVTFILAPRCLSPLIYGLRDENFYVVLRYYAFFGLNKKISPVLREM